MQSACQRHAWFWMSWRLWLAAAATVLPGATSSLFAQAPSVPSAAEQAPNPALPPHAEVLAAPMMSFGVAFAVGPVELRQTLANSPKAPTTTPPRSTSTESVPNPKAGVEPTKPVPTPGGEPSDGATIDPESRPSDGIPPSSASLSLGDPFFDTLPRNEQREAMAFAESLPRYLADPAEDGFLHQAEEVLFPEPVDLRIGRASVGGGLLTAIARRNPFALLNILDVFHLSW